MFRRNRKKRAKIDYQHLPEEIIASDVITPEILMLVDKHGLLLAQTGATLNGMRLDVLSAMVSANIAIGTKQAKQLQAAPLRYTMNAMPDKIFITMPIADINLLVAFKNVKSLDEIVTIAKEMADHIQNTLNTT